MKNKLSKLGLSNNTVNEVLNIFDTYQQSVKQYSKPKSLIAFQDNMSEIQSLSKKLLKKLKSLSRVEQQILNQSNQFKYRDLFDFSTQLICLSGACDIARKKKIRFSRRAPFLIALTVDLWKLLESHGIAVKKYKNNMLCHILETLLPESEMPRKHKKDDSEAPENLWAFHLLREASKYFPKN